jgi:Rrf2 family cysteine metabolism transcriptional repressor
MHLTKKHQYGVLAMVELGFLADQGPVHLRCISDKTKIPHAFLEQLMLSLKRAGLVESHRGAKGGYKIVKSPTSIMISHIIWAIDPVDCCVTESDPLSFLWKNLNEHVQQFFDSSLQSIMDEILKKEQVLMYAI